MRIGWMSCLTLAVAMLTVGCNTNRRCGGRTYRAHHGHHYADPGHPIDAVPQLEMTPSLPATGDGTEVNPGDTPAPPPAAPALPAPMDDEKPMKVRKKPKKK